jgi:hypothetical protein
MMNHDLGKIRELVEKALVDDDLKNLCFDHFMSVYTVCSQTNKSETVRQLVYYASTQNEIEKLLTLVSRINPSEYQKFIEEKTLLNQQLIPYKFPELLNFDLDVLVFNGMNEIIGKQGLIGLSMCCKEYYLAINFCQRLEQRLGRGKSTLVQPITISYFKTVHQAFNDIKSHQEKLKNHDVICLVKIDISDKNSTAPQDFWNMVYGIFKNVVEHRLIIVIVSAKECVLPKDVLDLKSPQFQKADAQKWISDIIAKMQPIEEWSKVEDLWLSIMIDKCQSNDPNFLDISEVYDHLRVTLNWLKKSPSPQEFLQKF